MQVPHATRLNFCLTNCHRVGPDLRQTLLKAIENSTADDEGMLCAPALVDACVQLRARRARGFTLVCTHAGHSRIWRLHLVEAHRSLFRLPR
jgi:hypothetical protein